MHSADVPRRRVAELSSNSSKVVARFLLLMRRVNVTRRVLREALCDALDPANLTSADVCWWEERNFRAQRTEAALAARIRYNVRA